MTDLEIQEKAEEIATKYRIMRYGLGKFKKYSIDDFMKERDKILEHLKESDKTKAIERSLTLVGLDGDRGNAHDKLLRDFPG